MSTPSESIATPATLLHREVWNRGDLALIEDLVAPNYRHTDPLTSSPITGAAALKTHIERYRNLVPDLEKTITHTVAEDDTVVLAYTATGTVQADTLPPIAEFTVPGAYVATVEDGRLAYGSDIWDVLAVLAADDHLTDSHRP